MSERAPRNHEAHSRSPEGHNHIKGPEVPKIKHESLPENSAEQQKETIEKLRHEVANKATSGKETLHNQQHPHKPTVPQPRINKELKDLMFNRTLVKVQKQLSPAKRTFSKVIHKNSIDTISNIGEKTIARPFGILGGGLLALLGSVFSTYLSRQFGMKYNLIVFAFLFMTGYLIASILEAIFLLLKRKKQR